MVLHSRLCSLDKKGMRECKSKKRPAYIGVNEGN